MARSAVLALVLLLCAPALGSVAGAASHRHGARCPKQQVRVKGRCLRRVAVPKRTPAATSLDGALRALTAVPPRGRRAVSPALIRAALRKIKHLDALATLVPPPAASAARRGPVAVAAGESEAVSAGGWSGTATADVPVHDDFTGTDITAHVDLTNQEGVKADQHEKHQALVADCPDAQGHVPGTAERSWSLRIQTPPIKDGMYVVLNFSYDAKFTVTGQTSDDATLHDWQQRMEMLAHVQLAVMHAGKVIMTNPPAVWTYSAAADLLPGKPHELTPDMVSDFQGPGVYSVLGKQFVAGDMERAVTGVLKIAAFLWYDVADEIQQQFASAKAKHWDTGDCVKLSLTPAKQQLAPGETTTVTAQITGPKDKGLAPARLTASATGGASVAPGTADMTAAPVQLSTTAPTPFDQGASFEVRADVRSKQGLGHASVTFTPTVTRYELRYTHATAGSATDTYNFDSPPYLVHHGTWTESRDVQVSASVPLTAAADGTYQGSGPLRWDRSSWSTDDVGTISNNGGGTCSSDDQEAVASVADGALTVSSLAVGPTVRATLDAQDLTETWHQHDVPTAGPCPGKDADYLRAGLLGELAYVHAQAGDHPSDMSNDSGLTTSVTFTVDSGWQAGSGDVVATRTVTGGMPVGPDSTQSIPYTDTLQIVRMAS